MSNSINFVLKVLKILAVFVIGAIFVTVVDVLVGVDLTDLPFLAQTAHRIAYVLLGVVVGIVIK